MTAPVRESAGSEQSLGPGRQWEPRGVLLGSILLGAIVGIPFAFLGYRHSWAYGYTGVVIIAAGIVIGIVAAVFMTWRGRGALGTGSLVGSVLALYLVVSTVVGIGKGHFERHPDYNYIPGYATGRSFAVAYPGHARAAMQCQQQAGASPDAAAAHYLRGCLDGVDYQLAHPSQPLDPGVGPPPGVRFPTVRN